MPHDPRRRLPAIGKLVAQVPDLPHPLVVEAARALVEAVRGGAEAPADWGAEVRARVATRQAMGLRRVINATGVVLHTNLGRAPLAPEAVTAVTEVAGGWSNLELDLDTGERGERVSAIARRICAVTGAEAAIAVNNNAAAVLLVLTAVSLGREVIVSRGELVEIGGSFRVPEVIAAGGARLREVGTTNRTRAADFAGAIGPDTGAILRVHRSNFTLSGFVESPDRAELLAIARAAGVPLIDDLGSGALVGDLGEPTVAESLATADLACFSGDKLLGGPQAGIICGRADLVMRARRHPMYRALRLDRLVLAALEATLAIYEAGSVPPAVAALRASAAELRPRAEALAAMLRARGLDVEVVAAMGLAGGGALPGVDLPGFVVRLARRAASDDLARLRRAAVPVIARLDHDALLLDPRTLLPGDELALVEALVALPR